MKSRGKTLIIKVQEIRSLRCVTVLVLIGFCLGAIYYPLLNYEKTIGGMDFLNLVFPQSEYGRQVISAGFIPLWNWHTWGGSPLLAAAQSAVLYPATWLSWAIGLPFGLQLNIFLHLVIAASGAFCVARYLFAADFLPSIAAAVAYSGSGFFLGHVEQVNSVAALAWTPWFVYGFVQHLRTDRYYSGLIIALSTSASFFAGHPQHILTAISFAEIYGIVYMLMAFMQGIRTKQQDRRVFCRFVSAQCYLLVGGLLSTAQLFPLAELSSYSERIWPYSDPYTPYFHLRHLPAFFMPRFFNRLAGTDGQPIGYTEEGVYVGILMALLASLGIYKAIRSANIILASALIVLVLAFLFACGPEGGVAPLIFNVIRFFEKLRGTARALNIVVLLVTGFAAYGLTALLKDKTRVVKTTIPLGAIALTTLDYAFTHQPELSSLMVPRAVLTTHAPHLGQSQLGKDGPGRIYRFMMRDSDLYLDHRASAVAERIVRHQPNYNMILGSSLVDGYEEGLLPTWRLGNFLRRFNRNLRNSVLDAPLLAVMGVTKVFSEYPLPSGSNIWRVEKRFPSRFLLGTTYELWEHIYPTAWFYDAKALLKRESFQDDIQRLFANSFYPDIYLESKPIKIPPGMNMCEHLLRNASPEAFRQAVKDCPLKVFRVLPNKLSFRTSQENHSVIFAGVLSKEWKLRWDSQRSDKLHVECPWAPFSLLQFKAPGQTGIHCGTFEYNPMSYRLGVFVTLSTLGWLLSVFAPRHFLRCKVDY